MTDQLIFAGFWSIKSYVHGEWVFVAVEASFLSFGSIGFFDGDFPGVDGHQPGMRDRLFAQNKKENLFYAFQAGLAGFKFTWGPGWLIFQSLLAGTVARRTRHFE